jgi:hypothetical protein
MWRVLDELGDFSVAVFDDTDVWSLPGNDDNASDSVITILLFLWIVVKFGAVEHVSFYDFDGLAAFLVHLGLVYDNFHVVGIYDEAVDVIRVDLNEFLVESACLFDLGSDKLAIGYEFLFRG